MVELQFLDDDELVSAQQEYDFNANQLFTLDRSVRELQNRQKHLEERMQQINTVRLLVGIDPLYDNLPDYSALDWKRFYITIGSSYRPPEWGKSIRHPVYEWLDGRRWIEAWAPSREAAKALVWTMLGSHWSSVYQDEPDVEAKHDLWPHPNQLAIDWDGRVFRYDWQGREIPL